MTVFRSATSRTFSHNASHNVRGIERDIFEIAIYFLFYRYFVNYKPQIMTKRSLNNEEICEMLLEVLDVDDSDYDATFEPNESCSDTTDGSDDDDEIREENEEQCEIQTDEVLHDGQIHTTDVNNEEMTEESDEWVDIEGEIEEFAFDENTGLKVDVGNVPNPIDIFSIFF